MMNRSSPSGAPDLQTIRFCASAFDDPTSAQAELFDAADSPSVAGTANVDSVAEGLDRGVAIVGRAQLRSLTVRNRVAGTTGDNDTYTIAIQRFDADDLSTKISLPLDTDGNTALTIDNLSTDPQHFSIPLASSDPGPSTGFEDGDILCVLVDHDDFTAGGGTGATDIAVEVNLQNLPDRTIFDDES